MMFFGALLPCNSTILVILRGSYCVSLLPVVQATVYKLLFSLDITLRDWAGEIVRQADGWVMRYVIMKINK